MEFKIQEETPVKKTIQVNVSPEEVDAAIAGTLALYKDSAQIDGFRKGKVPASIIENKFHDQIYDEAKENLINVHINDILTQLKLTPVSGIHMQGDDKALEKGKDFSYTISFEVLPEFTLPVYEGLKVEEEKTVPNEKEMEMVLEKLRADNAELVSTSSDEPARDGQIAIIDFEAFEDGKPVQGLNTKNFNLQLGSSQALPEFEQIVKGTPKGHTTEKNIKIPDDFIAPALAGKDLTFRVTVSDIKDRVIPALDNSLAKKIGFDSVEQLKQIIGASYLKNIKDMNKAVAQRKLLNEMLEHCQFDIPQDMLNQEVQFLIINEKERLEQQGKSLNSLGKSKEELRQAVLPQAENMARDKVLLLSIAKKENLEISPEEVQKNVYQNCVIHGEDYQEVMKNLENNGLMFHLRDQMLCDKAMDLVYDRADVTIVDPASAANESAEPSANKDAEATGEAKPQAETTATEDDKK